MPFTLQRSLRDSLIATFLFALVLTPVSAQTAIQNPVFKEFDLNEDGFLSRVEAFTTGVLPPNTPPIVAELEAAFELADQDQDGQLSAAEFQQTVGLQTLMRREQRLRLEVIPEFDRRDLDFDSALSVEELLADRNPDQHYDLIRWMRMFDFDGDGKLSLTEYFQMPEVVGSAERSGVVDPLIEKSKAVLEETRARFEKSDLDQDGKLSAAEWIEFAKDQFYANYQREFDFNQDGSVTLEEAELGILVAYGVRDANNVELRRGNGKIFNWRRYIDEIDANRNLKISRDEIGDRLPQNLAPIFQTALFNTLDLNRDGELDAAEISAAGQDRLHDSWFDQIGKFMSADTDQNGLLTPEELAQNVPPWEQKYNSSMFPAYDLNGDGLISFMEYRGAPLGNFFLIWMDHRDQNGDGFLSLEEYHPRAGLPFLGVSKFFYDKLDQNQDGRLSLNEYDFVVDHDRIPAESLIFLFDKDGDGRLSKVEALSLGDLPPETVPLSLHTERAFAQADTNQDGFLSVDEFQRAPDALSAFRNERRLRQEAEPLFRRLDLNQDGKLDSEELSAWSAEDPEMRRRQWIRMIDFDEDGQLTFTEFVNIPAVLGGAERTGVPDPIIDLMEAAIAAASSRFKESDLNQDGQLDGSEWSQFAGRQFFAAYRDEFDLDHNGQVSLEELEAGLRLAYGTHDREGYPLRRDTSETLNWRTFVEELDHSRNRRVTFEEMAHRRPENMSTQQQFQWFQKLDLDGDGELKASEIGAAGNEVLFESWMNQLHKFANLDSDRDGVLSPDELAANVTPWEQKYVKSMFPAYDTDRDNKISFMEYRGTPLGNFFLIWMDQQDMDGNGFITLEEFHPRAGLPFLALSKVFFDKLDQNRDGMLGVDEYHFPLNLEKIPTNLAFNIFDKNLDGILVQEEYLEETLKSFPKEMPQYARQSLMMKLEEAFRYADKDRNGELSYEEFRVSQAALGTTEPTASQPNQRLATPPALKIKAVDKWPEWRWYVLGTINVLLVLSIVWWMIQFLFFGKQSRNNSSKASP